MRDDSVVNTEPYAAPPVPAPATRKTRSWKKGLAFLTLICIPAICFARQLSVVECVEASDFISNAALARDSGVSEARFIDKLQGGMR